MLRYIRIEYTYTLYYSRFVLILEHMLSSLAFTVKPVSNRILNKSESSINRTLKQL